MKKLLGKIVFGVGMGCFSFVGMLLIGSAIAGGANEFIGGMTGEELLRSAAGMNLIALGYAVPSLIYEREELSLGLRTLLHMAVGTLLFLFVSYFMWWFERGLGTVVLYVLIAIGIAAVIWGIYMVLFRLQAKQINQKIREKDQT